MTKRKMGNGDQSERERRDSVVMEVNARWNRDGE